MERWFITMKKADFNGIAEKYHISPIIARLIRNRDVIGDEEIDFYLNGTIADLYDGMLMKIWTGQWRSWRKRSGRRRRSG